VDLSWHGARNGEIGSIGQIARELEEVSEARGPRFPDPAAALLVVGHADAGGGDCTTFKARQAPREESASRIAPLQREAGRDPVYAQAAGEDPNAPEGTCDARHYGTAGVYLIAGLK
jgi:hypothetical protein